MLLLSALAVAIIFRNRLDWFTQGIWLGSVLLLVTAVTVTGFRSKRFIRETTDKHIVTFINLCLAGAGLIWGVMAFHVLTLGDNAVQISMGDYGDEIVLIFLSIGLATSVAAMLAPLRSGCVALIVFSILPMAVRFALTQTGTGLIIAVLLLTVLTVLLLFAFDGHTAFIEGVEAKRDNSRLLEELSTAHDRLADAIDRSPAAIALFDKDEQLITCNQKYKGFFFPSDAHLVKPGTDLETLMSVIAESPLLPLAERDSMQYVEHQLALHRDAGKTWETQLGDGRWIQAITGRTRGQGLIVIAADVTDRVRRDIELSDYSELLQCTLENMDQGLVAVDTRLDIIAANKRVTNLADMPADLLRPGANFRHVIEYAARRGDYGTGDPDQHVKRLLRDFETPTPHRLERHLPDGTTLEIRVQPMPGGGFVITYTDITSYRRTEAALREKTTYVQLLQRAALEANDAPSVEKALQTCVDLICEHTGWPVGHAYLGQKDGADELIPTDLWHLDEPERHAVFRRITEKTSFALGEGLPGRVLAERKAAWIADVTRDKHFIRAQTNDPGVRAGFAFPVFAGKEIVAVLEFYSDHVVEPDLTLLGLMSHVGAQLGDIIERKRIEEARRESEERYRGLVELSQELILILRNHRVVFINPAGARMLGAESPADVLGRHVMRIIHPDFRAVAKDRIRKMQELGEPAPTVHQRYIRLDGKTVDVEVTSTPFDHPDGPSIQVVARDITERIKAERALKESQQILNSVINAVPAVINLKDRSGRYVFLNDYERELYDLKPGEEVDRTAHELMGDQNDQKIEEMNRQVIASGEAIALRETSSTDSQGRTRHWLTTKVPLFGEDGDVNHVVTVALDIAKRKEDEETLRAAKEEAELASRSKSEFLANMSHELRTPLNAIIGFSEILSNELMGSIGQGIYREYSKDIHDSGIHLLSLINDILDLSKVEAGKYELQEELLDVAETVTAAVRIVRGRAKDANLTLEIELKEDMPLLYGDGRAIKQMLLNLLSNAIKFTPAGGKIVVQSDLDSAGSIGLMISDTGIGIARKDLTRVMAPFGQVVSSLTRQHDGTGLGLPLIKSLTELHGAELKIKSKPGAGTMAAIIFPSIRSRPPSGERVETLQTA